MPQYTTITLTSAIAQLSARLNDSANIHWSQSELQFNITEALRVLQSLTGNYRERAQVATIANQVFYNLRVVTPLQYAFTVTDNQLLSEIQYHLKEPSTNPWTGTLQYNISSIASALTRARDQYQTDTGIYVTQSLTPNPIVSSGRLQLSQTTIDVRRAAWQDTSIAPPSTLIYGLVRTDEYAALGYSPDWAQTPDTPISYSVALTPPLSLQLIPSPPNAGNIDLCTVNSGPTLTCSNGAPVIIGLPDDFCWGTKYFALADLFGEDGPASDQDRSQYCRTLYNLCMSVGRSSATILQAQFQALLTFPNSIDDFDRYRPNWQNETPAPPVDLLQVSPNLFALSPVPDDIYNLTLDMVRSMPVPLTGSDPLQISSDLLDPVLDWAQHISCLKSSGDEFHATFPLRDNFLRVAAIINSKLRANIFYNLLLSQPATRQDSDVPRLVETK